jgi:hypothetical protein
MQKHNGYAVFTGILLILGAVMVPIGMGIRPFLVEQNFNFDVGHFDTIRDAPGVWILSYQIAVFGLFMRLAGLVALGSLNNGNGARTVLLPGIAIAVVAILVNALSSGYYMHMGFWGADELRAVSDRAAGSDFLARIRPGSEYMICLERMGKMFFSLGLVFMGAGLWLGHLLPRWLGIGAGVIGLAGMAALFVAPLSETVFLPFDVAIALWFAALGVSVIRLHGAAVQPYTTTGMPAGSAG